MVQLLGIYPYTHVFHSTFICSDMDGAAVKVFKILLFFSFVFNFSFIYVAPRKTSTKVCSKYVFSSFSNFIFF